MARAPRIDVADLAYRVINHANGLQKILHTPEDYKHFEVLLIEAKEHTDIRILAYVLMPGRPKKGI